MSTACALCTTSLPSRPITDEQLSFCCVGCHAVYKILDNQGNLIDFEKSPIFQEALRSGLISNPELLESIKQGQQKIPEKEWQIFHLEISDLWCPACSEVIQWIMLQQRGVRSCVVDYATDLASIEFAPRFFSKEGIIEKIRAIGYQAKPFGDEKATVDRGLLIRFGVGLFFAFNVMMLAYPLYAAHYYAEKAQEGVVLGWLSLLLALPVFFFSGWPILKRTFTSLKAGIIGMEALVSLAVTMGMSTSIYHLLQGDPTIYFDSMSVIIVLVLLGKILETRAKFSAKSALKRLIHSIPKKGRKRFSNGDERFTLIKEMVLDDLIVVKAGERIVLDGIIVEGKASCDESVITGESKPIIKREDSKAVAGTLITSGFLVIKVTHSLEEGVIYKMIDLVTKDLERRPHYIRLTDQITSWIVPTVIGLALMVALLGYLERAMAILLIACPCAIGIAVPLAESQLLRQLSDLGIVIRNRAVLPLLSKVEQFFFDKTGTLTKGNYTVLSDLSQLSEEEQNKLKALTAKSIHPVAQAVHHVLPVTDFTFDETIEEVGFGIRGKKGDDEYLLGSRRLMELSDIQTSNEGNSFYAKNGNLIATISLGEELKEGVVDLIKTLEGKKQLLSGDQEKVVKEIAAQCKIDCYYAEKSPLEKREIISKKEGVTCFIGDGVNDAPALTAASIGISVSNAADLSIQVSDVLLTSADLKKISQLFFLAKLTRKKIFQNLFWAFFYNIIGIGLALLGYMHPLYAAFAMIMSSSIILLNTFYLQQTSFDKAS